MSWKKLSITVLVLGILLIMSAPSVVSASTEYHVYPGQSIQAAIESASAGDVVIVHAGTYHQFVVFEGDDSGIIVRGDGAILDGTGYPTMEVVGITILESATGVTIDGFVFLNYRSAIVLDGACGNTVQNNVMSGGFWDGINLANAHYNLILNNRVSDCTIDGIWLGPRCDEFGNPISDGSNYNQIIGNQISSCHGGVILDTSHYNLVLNNKVSDSTGEGPEQGPGIFVGHTASYNSISGNKISGCNDGIGIGNTHHNQILKNKIENSSVGIFLGPDSTGGNPTYNTVNGNDISGCKAGIGLCNAHHNNIEDNKIESVSKQGIFFGTDELGNGSTYNMVTGNNLSGCGAGIILDQAEYNTIEDNKVKGSEKNGIGAISSTNNSFTGNKVADSGKFDLLDDSYTGSIPPPLDNTWQDNKYDSANWEV